MALMLRQYALVTKQVYTSYAPSAYWDRRAWAFYQWENTRYDAGKDLMRDACEEFPDIYDCLFWYGTFHLQRGYPNIALESLERAVELVPTYIEGQNNLGVILEMHERYHEALESYFNAADALEKYLDNAAEQASADGETTGKERPIGSNGFGPGAPFANIYLNVARMHTALADGVANGTIDIRDGEEAHEGEQPLPTPTADEIASFVTDHRDGAQRALDRAISLVAPDSGLAQYANGMKAFHSGDSKTARARFVATLKLPDSVFPIPPNVLTEDDKSELRAARFSNIYDRAFWGYQKSGPGSSLKETNVFRQQLAAIIQEHNIKSILDVGCGDWTWMPTVNLSGIDYFGVDIVPQLIQDNTANAEKLFGGADRPDTAPSKVEFAVLDAVTAPPPGPARDLIICREVLIHNTLGDIGKFLRYVSKWGGRFLITDMDDRVTSNSDVSVTQFALPGAGWRPINLFLPPFNLGEPIIPQLDRGAKLWGLPLWDGERQPVDTKDEL